MTGAAMIYDCFPFFNELDLLEIRLNELAGVVDRFVLVEAELTHNGDAKPLCYEENRERFSAFADRIVHVVVTAEDFAPAEKGSTFQERAWMRENIQRNAISRGLAAAGASEEDIVVVSDVDEIPRASAVRDAVSSIRPGDVVGLALGHYNYFLNMRNVSSPVWGNDPKAAMLSTFHDEKVCGSAPWTVFVLEAVNRGATATRFRYAEVRRRIRNAGWHFSYCGGVGAVVKKLRAFNEFGLYGRAELEKYVSDRMSRGKTLVGFDRCMPEKFDDRFPGFAVANASRFSGIIADDTNAETVAGRLLRAYFRLSSEISGIAWRVLVAVLPECVREAVKRTRGRT